MNFRGSKITIDRQCHYVILKGQSPKKTQQFLKCIHQQNCKIFYAKTDRTERTIEKSTIIVGDFTTPLSTIDRTRQKRPQHHQSNRHQINIQDLIKIYRTFYPIRDEYIFLSSAQWTNTRIDNILGHKPNLNQFKRSETIQNVFFHHNRITLKINN